MTQSVAAIMLRTLKYFLSLSEIFFILRLPATSQDKYLVLWFEAWSSLYILISIFGQPVRRQRETNQFIHHSSFSDYFSEFDVPHFFSLLTLFVQVEFCKTHFPFSQRFSDHSIAYLYFPSDKPNIQLQSIDNVVNIHKDDQDFLHDKTCGHQSLLFLFEATPVTNEPSKRRIT